MGFKSLIWNYKILLANISSLYLFYAMHIQINRNLTNLGWEGGLGGGGCFKVWQEPLKEYVDQLGHNKLLTIFRVFGHEFGHLVKKTKRNSFHMGCHYFENKPWEKFMAPNTLGQFNQMHCQRINHLSWTWVFGNRFVKTITKKLFIFYCSFTLIL